MDTAAVMVVGKPLHDVRMLIEGPNGEGKAEGKDDATLKILSSPLPAMAHFFGDKQN